jgi:protease I
MEKKLKGKKVAILVADGFEQVELTEPKKALEEAGAITEIVSPPTMKCRGGTTTRKRIHFQLICP